MRFKYIPALFGVLAFVIKLTEADQLCSSCVDIARPEDCDRHTKCDDTEQCYHRQYTKGSSPPLYELGCISSLACTTTPIIGKRAAGLHFKCFACCNHTALCNQMSDCGKVMLSTTSIPAVLPHDCSELQLSNHRNGSYTIYPYGVATERIPVYCEFDSDGAWTVIQRRFNGSVDFYRNWTEYKRGFGSSNGEYWLGNDNIHQLTSLGSYTLKILLTDWNNASHYAEYSTFYVANETYNYRLTIGGYHGNYGDAMAFHNGKRFSTWDRDNDESPKQSCVYNCGNGAWWHGMCCHSSLNGVYSRDAIIQMSGVLWHGFKAMKIAKMMIKRK